MVEEETVRDVAAPFGQVVAVRRLRDLRKDERPFNGQAFVEMIDEAAATALATAARAGKLEQGEGGRPVRGSLLSAHFALQEKIVLERRAAIAQKREAGDAEKPIAHKEYGKVLRFEGVGIMTTRDQMIEVCGRHGEVAHVDYSHSSDNGYARFQTATDASTALDGLSKGCESIAGAAP